MKASEIHEHFRAVGSWVNWERTTDTFKAGDPDRDIRTVAVVWKPDLAALELAHRRGTDMLVVHEAICANAVNGSPEPEVHFALDSERAKFLYLQQTGMAVYRCHEVWDRFPKLGVRASWQQGLSLGGQIIADQYPLLVTQIEPTTLGDLARHVLRQTQPLGQDVVLICGEAGRRVSRVATGAGVTTDVVGMKRLGADVGIVTDDYYLHCRIGAHAREIGLATITVNHGVSEEWGVQNLAAYVAEIFPDLEVFHIPQRCPYSGIWSA